MKKLISWSKSQYKDLPWRQNRTLYKTLVSEIMLQQTTVGTVVNHFDRFLDVYPTVQDLAASTEEEVCIHWKGLGYYRRARNLRKAAIDIVENFDGEIPLNYKDLISIAGIGDYTANAILSIGADKKALAVDANIERIIARLYYLKEKKGPKLIKKISKLFSEGEVFKEKKISSYRDLNEALMDVGRVYCQARKVDCFLCPLSDMCESHKRGEALEVPIIEKKVKESFDLSLLRVIVIKNDQILGYEKLDTEWLSGQREIPTYAIRTSDQSFKQYPKLEVEIDISELQSYKTAITKYKITNFILVLSESRYHKLFGKKKKFNYYTMDLEAENFSTSSIKALSRSIDRS